MKVTNAALVPYLERIRALPFVTEATVLSARSSDDGARLRLKTPTAKFDLGVVLHGRNLDRVSATLIAERLAGEATASVVFAPAVSEALGELFEQRGVAFVDRQGNCSLCLGERYIARIQGRRAPRPEPKDRGIRAAGYQVMLALLTVPELARRPLREIAAASGTSVTAPADMLRRLTDEGYLARTRHGLTWVETRHEDLVDRFLVGYRDVLRPRLLLGRYKTPLSDPRKLEARLVEVLGEPDAWRWGGAAAAYRIAHHYRSSRTVVHHSAWSAQVLAKIPAMASPDGDLIVLRSPGPGPLQGPQSMIVHPLLVVAELLAEPDERGWQVAAEIRETLRS